METQHFDVLVVGAGLSGVAAAYYLQTSCPGRSFAILEGRSAVGGTWDLFRYPGIRSDSDMHTLGFSFFPWKDPKAIADGPAILGYIQDAVAEYNLEPKIHFGRHVGSASWSSETSLWTVNTQDPATGKVFTYTCGFLWACTGYYAYESGYTPTFPGRDAFTGDVVHPQQWPENLDYSNKNVVVIGSGATAVTLVPELAKHAAHVTMLQRSPTYIMSIPAIDKVADTLTGLLGENLGSTVVRWKNILRMMLFFQISRRHPRFVGKHIVDLVRDTMGPDYNVDTHFSPTYDPWDQRVCFVPDDDLFDALKRDDASIVTANIASFTERGIELDSGEELEADIIVTATGLRLEILGGATFEVDGAAVNPGERFMYKGTMLSDVPNSAISLGYTNASWTLKCELIAQYVCRLLNHMDKHDHTQVWPRADQQMAPEPLLDFKSGYVLRALDDVPNQGSHAPWRLYQNYFLDRLSLKHRAVHDGVLEFVQKLR